MWKYKNIRYTNKIQIKYKKSTNKIQIQIQIMEGWGRYSYIALDILHEAVVWVLKLL